MATPARPLTPFELVRYIAEDRTPTDRELSSVAQHIWLDYADHHSTLGWNQLSHNSPQRHVAFQVARSALCGASNLYSASA